MPSRSSDPIAQAIDAYRDGLLAGTWTADDSRRMLSLSRDPEALMAGIKQANQDPEVSAALARMMSKSGSGSAPGPETAQPTRKAAVVAAVVKTKRPR